MLAIQFADIDYDDKYEGGASNSAKINQLTFQKNSEQLVKSEPTDNSQVGGRISKAGYQLKKVNNLLPFFVGI